MTADEIRDALRRRHPAEQHMGSRIIHGAWTTIEEWMGIDLLAISAHSSPSSGGVPGVRYPRVGYEVKVSRSDYRRELLRPNKRTMQRDWCNAFYFAVPRGLLTDDELAYEEPEWDAGDFRRSPCPYSHEQPGCPAWGDDPGPCYKGKRETRLVGPLAEWQRHYRPHVEIPCDGCGGKGWVEKSRVEREAPTLWVPRDVGLVEVDGRGCHVTRKSPVRKDVPGIDSGLSLAELVRWISVRPDPRHVALSARTLGEKRRAA